MVWLVGGWWLESVMFLSSTDWARKLGMVRIRGITAMIMISLKWSEYVFCTISYSLSQSSIRAM